MLTDLDKRIDGLGYTIIGDEMRLRQITWYVLHYHNRMNIADCPSNLISNSLKFTNTGSITLRTRLIQPSTISAGDESPLSQSGILPPADGTNPPVDLEKGRDDDDLNTSPQTKAGPRMAIIRIEVQDTGVGLRPADMEEYVSRSRHVTWIKLIHQQNSTVLTLCTDRNRSTSRWKGYRIGIGLCPSNRTAQQRASRRRFRVWKRQYILA